jgi:hypothetical protein
MSTGTGFHPNQTWRQVGKLFQQLAARNGLFQHRLALGIGTVQTERILGQVDSNGCYIHVGLS